MDFAAMRDLFPVTQHYAYLNHASVAPLPVPVVEAMTRYLTERGLRGSEALVDKDADAERIRKLVGRFIGAHRRCGSPTARI